MNAAAAARGRPGDPASAAGGPAICGEVRRAHLLDRVSRISSVGLENVRIPPAVTFRAG
jgi:hypothetical protein